MDQYSQLRCQTTEAEFGPETAACSIPVLDLSPATVAFRILGAAGSFINRYARVLAYEALAGLCRVSEVRDDQLVGRLTLLLPLFDQADRVEVDVLRACDAGPVTHRGDHEEPHRLFQGARPDFGHDGA